MGCSFIADILALFGAKPQCGEINSGQERAPPPHAGWYRAQTGGNHKGSAGKFFQLRSGFNAGGKIV
jgi:hypothetical protein